MYSCRRPTSSLCSSTITPTCARMLLSNCSFGSARLEVQAAERPSAVYLVPFAGERQRGEQQQLQLARKVIVYVGIILLSHASSVQIACRQREHTTSRMLIMPR